MMSAHTGNSNEAKVRQEKNRLREGFTLLELMLALSLSTILLVVIGTAIQVLTQTASVGREDTQRTQLVRALFRNFERDLRSVVFIVPEEVDDEEDSAADEDTTVINVISEEDLYSGGSFGVVGGADWVQFTVTNATVSDSSLAEASTIDEFGDPIFSTPCNRRVITYQLATGGNTAFASTVTFTTITGDATGLARFEHEGCSSNTVAAAISEKVLAPEVTSLQLRYFDGVDWLTEWDSAVLGFIPQAIEMTLKIVPDSVNPRTETPGATSHRYVVSLPLAKQFVGENEL